ncbi:MAG TPA: DNA polymerase III subunit chi [Stenotrophobium sp.]|jgi:DNA polymerase-3 subunit chi|nr:DNA polymerase III subunit chi [Stenotrophobium sp.]
MTRIDFYILPDGGLPANSAVMTACRLCDKATGSGLKVYINVPGPAQAEELDGALWSFRQGSFIAHEPYLGQAIEDPQPMVLLGSTEPPASHHAVLINLGLDVPAFFSRFDRVLELVEGDAAQRAKSRERYKFYKDRGYELATYEQNPEGSWAKR